MRTRTGALMRVMLFVAAVAGGWTTCGGSEAHARCQVCMHNCCFWVRGDGFRGCTETRDPMTDRCIACKTDERVCQFMPSGDGRAEDAPNESSAYDEPTLASEPAPAECSAQT